jgi:hypothetical protein
MSFQLVSRHIQQVPTLVNGPGVALRRRERTFESCRGAKVSGMPIAAAATWKPARKIGARTGPPPRTPLNRSSSGSLLRIDIDGTRFTVAVDGTEALTLTETKATSAARNIGLFVEILVASPCFSNLTVTSK